MQNFRFNKKITILITAVFLLLAILAVVIFLLLSKMDGGMKKDANSISTLTILEDFTKAENRDQKAAVLKKALETYAGMTSSDAMLSRYEDAISEMRAYFTKEYDKLLSQNTLDPGRAGEKERAAAVQGLRNLITSIQKEKLIAETDARRYQETAETLIRKYQQESENVSETPTSSVAAASSKPQVSSSAAVSSKPADKPSVVSSRPAVSSSSAVSVPKRPKPAKYTVIKADDFPNDGWEWTRHTFAWRVSETEWGGPDGTELVRVVWEVSPTSMSSHMDIILGACENAKKFMPPAPTLEESKKMIQYGADTFPLRYGKTTLYVYVGD